MYRKVEIKIKTSDLFKKNNKYHLWITTFSTALQDLISSNKLLFSTFGEEEDKIFSFFLYKISLGFLKEAIDILESSLKSGVGDRIRNIKGFEKEYRDFNNNLRNNKKYRYVFDVINQSRNKVFHYNDFLKRKGDKKEVERVLDELYRDNHISQISISTEDVPLNNNYKFAEEIQLNQLVKIIERNNQSRSLDKDAVEELGMVMVKIIKMFEIIVLNFINSIPDNKKYMIRYR